LVRQQGWLTTDHPAAEWYRIIGHSADWSEVRLLVAVQPDADPAVVEVVVRPDGYVLPRPTDVQLGAEAIRIIATAIRAGQRRSN
jgi:hypothetical protein